MKEEKGWKLIGMIKDGTITPGVPKNHDRRFSGSYEQLHLDSFRVYLGTVSRHLQNKRIEGRKCHPPRTKRYGA